MEKRLNFFEIFKVNSDGSIEPLRLVRIGGVQLGSGVRFGKGVSFSGIDLSQYAGRDFLTEEKEGVLIVKGIF